MRELHIARLVRKKLLSEAAQCYHFEFAFEGHVPTFEAGQFLSLVADDAAGKSYTRAYSIASAPRGQAFDLCVNRVEGGFFSNLLCDMAEGATVQWHGPHGLFTLRQPVADTLLVAGGTGIAPLRGFLQSLFPESGVDLSAGRAVRLVYEGEGPDQLFYSEYFQGLAGRHANFRYEPVSAVGTREAISRAAAAIKGGTSLSAAGGLEANAYVCGLAELVKPARAQLLDLGWPRRQVLFERYD